MLLQRPGLSSAFRRAPFHPLRAVLLALAMVALAIGAHSFAGGSLPAPPILAALLALVLLASVLVTRFRLRLPAMTAVLGLGQLGLHEAFGALSATPVEIPGAGLHQHDGGAALVGTLQHLSSGMAAHDAAGHSGAMLLAHAVATALMALLLAQGEAALWALAAWLRPLFRMLLVLVPAHFRAPEAPHQLPLPRLPWRTLRRDRLRGPPCAVVVP
ncbi:MULTISPECIES: hypothetical protein [Arthrobacter]|uniref:MFS transporter n=2 Tax=Arthrobacter TaxID=1663 RepID=A0ABU9KHM1_9MICC|nr:hypothetical protein [Arthrobacter sp. YJM1]MDP5226607.1 hypothetical protein [Arthrobacter sp. YJM1]